MLIPNLVKLEPYMYITITNETNNENVPPMNTSVMNKPFIIPHVFQFSCHGNFNKYFSFYLFLIINNDSLHLHIFMKLFFKYHINTKDAASGMRAKNRSIGFTTSFKSKMMLLPLTLEGLSKAAEMLWLQYIGKHANSTRRLHAVEKALMATSVVLHSIETSAGRKENDRKVI